MKEIAFSLIDKQKNAKIMKIDLLNAKCFQLLLITKKEFY